MAERAQEGVGRMSLNKKGGESEDDEDDWESKADGYGEDCIVSNKAGLHGEAVCNGAKGEGSYDEDDDDWEALAD